MRRIAVLAYTARVDAITWATHAITRLFEEGVEVMIDDILEAALSPELASKCEVRSAKEFEKRADMVMTFGGDGTLLATARLLMGSDIPIMGVNVGKLGFLAEFPVTELDEAIMDVIKGNYRIVDRTTLVVEFSGVVAYALNEVLIERSSEAKMIAVRAFVNEHHVADYRADGVIICTPTGSTAYSLAAGGPIIAPSANALCITPIAPHTLTLRPLIVNDGSEIRCELLGENSAAHVVADGKILGTARKGETILIRKSEHLVKLVKRADSTYYDLLRDKLLWSADAIKK
ncbi:MAG: NAD(+)/NADH kinase [Candidatus Kapabacteria bacterium]|nr:NAD(+)/NADH kinase [Candidatus Kapabacteria bacterium]